MFAHVGFGEVSLGELQDEGCFAARHFRFEPALVEGFAAGAEVTGEGFVAGEGAQAQAGGEGETSDA